MKISPAIKYFSILCFYLIGIAGFCVLVVGHISGKGEWLSSLPAFEGLDLFNKFGLSLSVGLFVGGIVTLAGRKELKDRFNQLKKIDAEWVPPPPGIKLSGIIALVGMLILIVLFQKYEMSHYIFIFSMILPLILNLPLNRKIYYEEQRILGEVSKTE